MKIALTVALFAGLLGIAAYLLIKPRLQRRRRARLTQQPTPDTVPEILERNVGLYAILPAALKAQLHGHINVFLNEKHFMGLGGQVIDDEVAVTIAGTACLLLLNRKVTYFPGFESVLVYPTVYEANDLTSEGHIDTESTSHRAGESWHRGPLVLAWSSAKQGAANAADGYNVILHEFAHKLDEEHNGTNGQPVLHVAGHYQEWASVLGREFEAFADRVARRKNKVMDEYGLTNPAEFFAVATESFFEKGWSMRRRLPDLYDQLRKYYAVDPASWGRDKT
ncbi:MAG: M90 family metallopeptidase [Pseudomonadota bacterium]